MAARARYPQTGPAQLQLIADGEVDLAISFSPGEATAAIVNNQLPPSVRTFVLEGGTIGNASFVAIPTIPGSAAGAMVVANFLMSPEAQLRAQDPAILGYGTVLAMDKLADADRAAFEALDLGVATLSPAELGVVRAEPHPSWMTRIADDWVLRYGTAPCLLRFVPFLTVFLMLGPIVAGLWGTLLPAFGHLPSAGIHGLSLQPFHALLEWPGLESAAKLSLTTGFLATGSSLAIVVLVTAGWSGGRSFRLLQRLLSPLLSVPHAAAAFGLAFVITPSGWISRALSPWATDGPARLIS